MMLLCRPSAKKIEDGSENPFEIVSEVMGPDFALQASTNPVLLQQSQILVVSPHTTTLSGSTEVLQAFLSALQSP